MRNIETLREKINAIDTVIIEKLAERQKIVQEIGRLKSVNQINVVDEEREAQLKDMYMHLSEEYSLSFEYVWYIFSFIIARSKKLQEK